MRYQLEAAWKESFQHADNLSVWKIEETVDLNTISPVILIGEIYRPTVIRSVCAADLISDEDYVQVDFSSGQLHFY